MPEFLDAVQGIEYEIGTEPSDDWNLAWAEVQRVAEEYDVRWTAANRKLFRQCFTTVDSDAQPVIAKEAKRIPSPGPAAFPRQTIQTKIAAKVLAECFGIHAAPGGKMLEYEADPKLRDFENVPLTEHIVDYFLREVRPYVADAWIDRKAVDEQDAGIGKVGYEINFNREFFCYQPPRPLPIIDKELATVEKRILELLKEVTE